MFHFCQAPNWHFERSHGGKVQYRESNPGNENRRPALCPPLPGLKAAELDTGLRNRWQRHRDSVLLVHFRMPKMDIRVRCGRRKGYRNVMYCVCIYRRRLCLMYASQN